jgi:hypothetical protein
VTTTWTAISHLLPTWQQAWQVTGRDTRNLVEDPLRLGAGVAQPWVAGRTGSARIVRVHVHVWAHVRQGKTPLGLGLGRQVLDEMPQRAAHANKLTDGEGRRWLVNVPHSELREVLLVR